ncbi:hypothetical protein [Cryobacterium sp. Y57]|uniref:hypothetical protein n=1 Tax=Cryobacterium sp. Y57 TaxID=2048287 RepID=UPI000CE4E656|nr:hypothetical protein [Cryobacterium sp. Y57]
MTTIKPADEPSTDEQNPRADKASFLILLERLGDATATSAELGINRGAGYRWARSDVDSAASRVRGARSESMSQLSALGRLSGGENL